jgi:hypothetical protein
MVTPEKRTRLRVCHQHILHPYISLLIIREDHLGMSNPGRQSKAASGRMLDDGSTPEKKEMGNGTGIVTSNSKDILVLRRFLHAGVDSDRMHTPVTAGKMIRKWDPFSTDLFHQSKISVSKIQRSMGLILFTRRPQIAQPSLLLPIQKDIGFQWREKERTRSEDGEMQES